MSNLFASEWRDVSALDVYHEFISQSEVANELWFQIQLITGKVQHTDIESDALVLRLLDRMSTLRVPLNRPTRINGLRSTFDGNYQIRGELSSDGTSRGYWTNCYNTPLIEDVALWQKLIALMFLRQIHTTIEVAEDLSVKITAYDFATAQVLLFTTAADGVQLRNKTKAAYMVNYLPDRKIQLTSKPHSSDYDDVVLDMFIYSVKKSQGTPECRYLLGAETGSVFSFSDWLKVPIENLDGNDLSLEQNERMNNFKAIALEKVGNNPWLPKS
jgi:hypothetical protein